MPSFRFRSFRLRIVVLFLALLVLVEGIAFLVVDAAHRQAAWTQIDDELLVASRVFNRLISARIDQLSGAARLLSGDFAFKSAYAMTDGDTVLSALQNQQARIRADVMVLVSTARRVVADTLHPRLRDALFPFVNLIQEAEDNGQAISIVFVDRRPYQVVVVPLLAPLPVAWIVMGFLIDDTLAHELQRLTHVHVTFVTVDPPGAPTPFASTLPPALRAPLAAALPRSLGASPLTFPLSVGGRELVSHFAGLGRAEDVGVAAILQSPVDEAFAPVYRLRIRLAALFVSSLLVSFVVGARIARSVSRPVETLVQGVHEIERGHYAHRVVVAQPDELGELAAAVNHMAVQIAEREEALLLSEEQLRQAQKMEAIGRLAGGIAHDFNNLLTVITGHNELLRAELGPEAAGVRAHVDAVETTVDRAVTLVRQLLAFSRKQVLQPRVLDLNEIVTNISTMLRRLIGEDIDLVMAVGAGLWPVKVDPGQFEQVIVNLAVNARDAMPGGGPVAPAHRQRGALRGRRAPGRRLSRARRAPRGDRHRRGDERGGPRPPLRAVLHDQGARAGHRARAVHGLRDPEAARGGHRR